MRLIRPSNLVETILCLALVLTGCGTAGVQVAYRSYMEDPSLYIMGGTVLDMRLVAMGIAGAEQEDTGILVLMLFDVPFSLVADTIVLPLTVYQQVQRSRWTADKFAEELLYDPDPGHRSRAARALSWFDPKSEYGTRVLREALDDTAPEVRRDALLALSQIGEIEAEDVIGLFDDPDAEVRSTAARKAHPFRETIPFLVQLLSDSDIRVRHSAVESLGAFGPDAISAIPSLQTISATDPQEWLREAAQSAIERIRGKVPADAH